MQAIAEAVQSAVAGKQQVVEPDHLAKALLEQPNGLARRIVVKVRTRLERPRHHDWPLLRYGPQPLYTICHMA